MKNFSKILFLPIFLFLIHSCEVENILTDDELIEAIINSEEKISVLESDLPNKLKNSISEDLPNDFIDNAKLAPSLGFQIEMRSIEVFTMGVKSGDIFFDTDGRKLERSKDFDKKDKNKRDKPCFKLKYPLTLELPNGKTVEVENRKKHCEVVKTYHSKSKSLRKEIKILFPVTVTFYDDNKNLIEKVMDNEKELQELKETCEQKDTKERKN
jgi:hypothetical protein